MLRSQPKVPNCTNRFPLQAQWAHRPIPAPSLTRTPESEASRGCESSTRALSPFAPPGIRWRRFVRSHLLPSPPLKRISCTFRMADALLHCRYAGGEDCGLHLDRAVKRNFLPARLLAFAQLFSFMGGWALQKPGGFRFSVAGAVVMRVKGKGYLPVDIDIIQQEGLKPSFLSLFFQNRLSHTSFIETDIWRKNLRSRLLLEKGWWYDLVRVVE